MRAVILADRSMAVRERGMLARLEVGLVAEGVRVVHAIPAECIDAEPIGLYSTPVAYENGWWWTREARVRRLAERLRKALEGENIQCVDVVHVFAESIDETWAIADRLAELTEAALLIEVVSAKQIDAAASFVRSNKRIKSPQGYPVPGDRAAPRQAAGVLGFACPDSAMERAVTSRVAPVPAFHTPWGVHADDQSPAKKTSPGTISIGLLATSKNRWLGSAIEGIAMCAIRSGADAGAPSVLIFVGTSDETTSEAGRSSAAAAHVWKLARRLGILSRLTLVPGMESKRDPVMSLDVLAITDCEGVHRSLTLDAMAAGVLVVAPPDGLVDDLEEAVTCRVVTNPSSSAWLRIIDELLSDPLSAEALRQSAWGHARRRRSAASQVVAVMRAYETLADSEVLAS